MIDSRSDVDSGYASRCFPNRTQATISGAMLKRSNAGLAVIWHLAFSSSSLPVMGVDEMTIDTLADWRRRTRRRDIGEDGNHFRFLSTIRSRCACRSASRTRMRAGASEGDRMGWLIAVGQVSGCCCCCCCSWQWHSTPFLLPSPGGSIINTG